MTILRMRRGGPYPHWELDEGPVQIRFVGRGPVAEIDRILAATASRVPDDLAWLRQIHGDHVLEATAGETGAADGLYTDRDGLALAVVSADCVPVVLADARRVAVAHAGWRGLEAGILPRLASELGTGVKAWIGPAIGACCYEVSPEVADRLVAVSDPAVVRPGPGPRPHLDLVAVGVRQLLEAGVTVRGCVSLCTRCHPDLLFSFRREGKAAGRNLTFAWREVRATGSSAGSPAAPSPAPAAGRTRR